MYSYKTILKAENFEFDIYKNRYNSKKSGIIALSKADYNKVIHVGDMDNKTGVVTITDEAKTSFKAATINKLLNKICERSKMLLV